MTKYLALLRAINVAGHACVKMSDLQRVFASAGCQDVRTVIQSGNVLFQAADGDASVIMRRIRAKLCQLLGREATVLFRKLREVEGIVSAAPFKTLEARPDVKLYVAFLLQKPRSQPKLPLLSSKEALEVIKMTDLEVFIVSRKKKNGMFGFPNNFIEKELGVPATTRNWSTVTKLVALSTTLDK